MRLDRVPKRWRYIIVRKFGRPPGKDHPRDIYHRESMPPSPDYLKEFTQGQLNWLAGRWHQPKLTSKDSGTNPTARDKATEDDTHTLPKDLCSDRV